tara:strand:+ start:123 stop:653 length:531 start_codon:yes stop_codon:yes gene_type:complete
MITIDGGTGIILHNGVEIASDKMVDQWRVHTNGSVSQSSSTTVTNWERVTDVTGMGTLNGGMTESSGIFTFPSTGIYKVEFTPYFNDTEDNNSIRGLIQTTTDNSSYVTVAQNPTSIADADTYNYGSVYVCALLDITNTSTHKVRFNLYSGDGAFHYNGDQTTNETYATFTRVGAT